MTRKVTCTNAQCAAVFEVPGREIGEVVVCPKCATECKVLAEFGDDFKMEVLTARDANAQMHHPARQVCTNCGAVLGVRAATCPKCHADIRTGQAIMREQVQRKRSPWPIVIGAIVGLVILGGAAVLIAALFASG